MKDKTINDRTKSILNRMDEKDYDGMLLTQFNNIKYVSNYLPSSFAICLLKEDPVIFTTAMDKELASNSSWIEVEEFKSISELKEVFNKENLKKIAIEGNLPVSSYKKNYAPIKQKKESWELSVEDFLEKERMIKSNNEIKMIKKSNRYCS